MPAWSQKIKARTFQADFCTWNFWGGVRRYAATPLIVALSLCHSDITRFCPWSPIMTGNHLDRAKEIPKVAQMTGTVDVFDPHWHFRTHFAESFHMSKSSWMMDPPCSCEMPSCSAIGLANIWLFSKISSWIWSIISRVVTLLGHPGRGTSQVEKSPRLNWATQFLTVAYYGACSPNVSVRMVWISFGVLPCRKKKLDNNLRLDVVEIAYIAWHAFFQPL